MALAGVRWNHHLGDVRMRNVLVIAAAERSFLIRRLLDEMNVCSVVEAWEAVEALATQTIHAVVIDYDSMEAGWSRVVENILDEGDDVAVILLATDAGPDLRRDARRLGIAAVVDLQRQPSLVRRVRAALDLVGVRPT
jgi:DNA-binding NarL/FixJ family response regulator